MDDEEPKRPKLLEFVLQGLAWILFSFLSLPVVILWFLIVGVGPIVVRVVLFGLGPATLLVVVTAHVPLALQVLALVIATSWLTFLVFRLMGLDLSDPEDEQPLVLISLLIVAIGLFASATFVLAERDAITVLNWESVDSPAMASVAFYVWHFFDTIPFLNATDALRWAEPLTYKDPLLGVLLLLFKLVIIAPIISALRNALRDGQAEGTGKPNDPNLIDSERE
jgi:hypothetical protein